MTSDLLPAVVELDKQCFGGLWTQQGYQRELDSPNSDILLVIPKHQESLPGRGGVTPPLLVPTPPVPVPDRQSPVLAMGCLWAILDEAHITIVAVHPQYQRQGLGQAMLAALLFSAQQRGLERATLEVKASNQAAISLYQKFGFQVAGQRRGYYKDTGEDALILWLSAIQSPKFQQNWAVWEPEILSCLAASGWDLDSLAIVN